MLTFHSIYIAATIATVLSLLCWGGYYAYYFKFNKYALLLLLTIPACPIINIFVKKPIIMLLKQTFNVEDAFSKSNSLLFIAILLFIPPVTEELIKALPGLIIGIRRFSDANLLKAAFFLGAGFGIGEIWYLAYGTSLNPQYTGYPFYYFVGFIFERFFICLIHCGLTVIALTGLKKFKRCNWMTFLTAFLCHALVNVGAMLFQLKVANILISNLLLIPPLIIIISIMNYKFAQFWNSERACTQDIQV